jgi:isopenicillin-N epimerase
MSEHKRDFGSFHSSNIEELVRLDDSVYKVPEKIVCFNSNDFADLNKTMFGSTLLKERLFYLGNEYNFLNHGAFGLTFKPVMEYTNKWRQHAESQPLRFYDRQVIPLLADLIRFFAKNVLNCKAEQLVLVENCTFAFNSIVNSINLKPNEKMLIFSTTYGVYKKILRSKFNQDLIEIVIKFPILNEDDVLSQIIKPFENQLNNDKSIKYVLIDHIPSNQPFIMPIMKLSEIAKLNNPNILVIVDGAHSIGSIKELNLNKMVNIDLLFMNCHKWFCGPKGTGDCEL